MSQPRPQTLGRYELVAQLATGGMGEIFLARLPGRAGFEKLVVLKRLLPELAPGAQFQQMFFDEARLAARLSHPNVCEVHELGEDAGQHYIVMQYLEGVPFSSVMQLHPIDVALVTGILAQACEGLHHAHELTDHDGRLLGVVHRDVSPSNLFVTADGVTKVLDFGIAKARGLTSVTEKGMLKGKFAYMSPEQLAEGPLDRRSDVFCLGIVAWEAVTGERLFKRDSVALAARAILEDPIRMAHLVNPAVPAELARVIARALERAPADRFASARELGAALKQAGGGLETDAIAVAIKASFSDELGRQRALYRKSATIEPAAPSPPAAREVTNTEPDAAPTSVARKRPAPGDAPVAPPGRGSRAPIVGAMVVAAVAIAFVVSMQRADHRAARSGGAGPLTVAAADAAAAAVPVAAADAAPAADAAAAPAAAADAAPAADHRPPSPAAPGTVSIDSQPYATLYIGKQRIGETPYIAKSLPAGRHRITARLKDGRSKTFTIVVPAGAAAPPVTLTW